LGIAKAASNHCRENFGATDSNIGRSRAKTTLQFISRTWNGNEDSAAFEVIRIRRREGFQIGNKFVEPAEVYPNSEAWGIDGFTLTDKDAAFAKLRELA